MSHGTHMNESYHMWMRATSHECHASRITHHASRITHHASRITHHASRISPRVEGQTTNVAEWTLRRISTAFLKSLWMQCGRYPPLCMCDWEREKESDSNSTSVCVCVCMRVCERACEQASVRVSERACEHACESPVDSRTNRRYCNIIQAIVQFIIHIHVYKPRTGRTLALFSVARGLTNQSPIPQHH